MQEFGALLPSIEQMQRSYALDKFSWQFYIILLDYLIVRLYNYNIMSKGSAAEKIISRMFNIGRAINKQFLEENKRKNRLSILQIETLRYVRENQGVLMKDLAWHLFITPPSATSLVNELVRAKLVGRSSSKKDRRITGISLTKKGKKVLEKTMIQKMEKIREKIDKLTAKEKNFLLKVFEKLAKDDN